MCRPATSQSRGVIPSGRKLDMGGLACAVWMAPTQGLLVRVASSSSSGSSDSSVLSLSCLSITTPPSAAAATSPGSSALHSLLHHPSTEAIAGTRPRADWRPQLWISQNAGQHGLDCTPSNLGCQIPPVPFFRSRAFHLRRGRLFERPSSTPHGRPSAAGLDCIFGPHLSPGQLGEGPRPR